MAAPSPTAARRPAGRPDLVAVAAALGLPAVHRFATAAGGFLGSAARQAGRHASAFAYLMFQRERRAEWRESPVRVLAARYEAPAAAPVRPGAAAAPAGPGAREKIAENSDEKRPDEPLTLEWGPGTEAADWHAPRESAAEHLEAWARGRAAAPVQFRGVIRSREADGKADFQASLCLQHFFGPAAVVECASRLCEAVEPPEEALLAAVGEQFPALTAVGRRVLLTDAAVVFGRPLLEDCTRVEVEVPLARSRILENYPDLLPFLDRVARLEVTLLSDDGRRAVCHWTLRGKEGLFQFCCYKKGRSVLWASPAGMPPGRGGADGPERPFRAFDFDLGREMRADGPLRARVVLAASFCGASFKLPQVDVLLRAEGGRQIVATVDSIERTWATTTATFLLGIGSVFDDLVSSVRVALALAPQGEVDGAGGGNDDGDDDDEPERAALAVDAKLTVPRSYLLATWVGRRVHVYVARWMAWVALFRDACEALAQDVAAHMVEVGEEI